MAEDKSIISYDNIISPTGVFDDLFANLDTLESRLKKLVKEYNEGLKFVNVNDTVAIEKQAIALRKLELAEEKLRLKKEALANAQKKKIILTNEELIQAQKEKQVQQERVKRAKQLAIIQKEQGNTIRSLRAQLSLVSLDWSKLTEEQIKNGKTAKDLSKRKLDLTNRLKALERATGDTRRNVGNYTDSLSKLGKTAARLFIGRTAVDFFRRIANGAKSLIDANKASSQSLTDLDNSLNETGGALSQVATILLQAVAPALTFVINGFKSFLGLFFDINSESKNFVATSDELKGTISNLEKEFVKEAGAVDQVFTALGNANEGSKERKSLIDQINQQYGKYLPNLLTEKSSLKEVAAAQNLVNEALSKNFLLQVQRETQTDIFIRKSKRTINAFNRIKAAAERQGETIGVTLSEFQDYAEVLSKSAIVSNAFKKVQDGTVDGFGELERTLDGAKSGLFDFAIQLSRLNDAGEGTVLAFDKLVKDTFLRNKAIGETSAQIKSLEGDIVTFDRAVDSSIKDAILIDNTGAWRDNTKERLKAIEELQSELATLEVESIEDRQERALALEELRFKEEQKLRKQNFDAFVQLLKQQEDALKAFYGKKSKEVIAFREKAGKELLQVEALNKKLSEEQLRQSEQNKLNIRIEFDKKTQERAKQAVDKAKELIKKDADDFAKLNKDILKEQQKSIQTEEEINAKIRKEANKKRLDDQKQLSKDIIKATAEASKAIQAIFDQEAKAAADAVSAQEKAVSNAEARAQAGLENTLKFEQEQLAQKELQRQQAEKRAKQAAEALALINLTVAAAQSGDKNAVQTGLVQFGVLKGLVAAIGSFYHGTEDTGTVKNPLDSNGGRFAILHDNERVLTKKQNSKVGKISNDELVENAIRGAAMSDYKPNYMLLDSKHYKQQTKQVLSATSNNSGQSIDISALKEEMTKTRKAIEKKPIVKEELSAIIGDVATITRKTVTNRMTRTEIIKKRL